MNFEQFKALDSKAQMLATLREGNDTKRLEMRSWWRDIDRAKQRLIALNNEDGWAKQV